MEDERAPVRVDIFLHGAAPEVSRSRIQSLIKSGNVCVCGNVIAECDYRVRSGDVIKLFIPDPEKCGLIPEEIPIEVVYEDEDVLIINKAAGMVVHPGAGNIRGTLVNALLSHCGEALSGISGEQKPGIVHRLDKETSGLMAVAKNDFSHTEICKQFETRDIKRTYWAITIGVPTRPMGVIETFIGRHHINRKKMAVVTVGGKRAVTNYKVIKSIASHSIVECALETGRTHQIRVHFSYMKTPILGDITYAPRKTHSIATKYGASMELRQGRHALHSKTLSFIHPRTKKRLDFQSGLPRDMSDICSTVFGIG
ncbi:pseudouridine synthase [Candidatus Hydrogenosomobacter endosymbioticus]|uniref:Pseudouridine synthase n=2 Tax=Candidatus Hydrogenosomobacter endosymbioticus TaxID=2558174 RepID=A0ABN6L2Q6_9PROT|nr:pseudouridine synthase [Candidatus Hydrogenosomobacter endosymbioticus]